MLKLKELLKLNSMTYSDKITDKHQKKINMKTEIITEVIVGEVLPLKIQVENLTRIKLVVRV